MVSFVRQPLLKRCLFGLACLLLLIGTPQRVLAKSFLWEVSSDTTSVYVFGSIHFARADFYPLAPEVEQAFEEASFLALELNPMTLNGPEFQQMIMQKGFYQGEETLEGNLSTETFSLLSSYLEKSQIPLQAMQKMTPPMAAILLSTTKLGQLGFTPDQGVDLYFAKRAANTKPILELETVEQQLSLLFDTHNADAFLKYTLASFDNFEQEFQQLVSSWKSGDAEAMDALMLQPYEKIPEFQPILEKVFFERNRKMAAKIAEMLKKNETGFVVVGAGHLVGEQGIIELLKKDRYRVKQR